jgi:uncharacterized protein YdaU (DUF1376 family)
MKAGESMAKAPAFQWFPRDYLTDEAVVRMSLEQQGAYVRLLSHQWLEGSIPADMIGLAALCGISAGKMKKLWPGLQKKFSATDDGRLQNQRMEEIREEQANHKQKQSLGGKRGAAKRWGGDKSPNGSPNGSPTPDPMASDSSASASATAIGTDTDIGAVAPHPKPEKPKREPSGWSAKACEAWVQKFGGVAPGGKIGAALKPLVKKYGEAEVLHVWTQYLATEEEKYISPAAFAQKYRTWRDGKQGKPAPQQYDYSDATTEWNGTWT